MLDSAPIMANPVITAIVDTYNHERFIEQALSSVLDQGLSVLSWKFWSSMTAPRIVLPISPPNLHRKYRF
jgi:hypothetical protein